MKTITLQITDQTHAELERQGLLESGKLSEFLDLHFSVEKSAAAAMVNAAARMNSKTGV